jgi:hypothetical protein
MNVMRDALSKEVLYISKKNIKNTNGMTAKNIGRLFIIIK